MISDNHSSTTPLSIITPVYNGECYIESCLLSVINQAYPFVEHIIIDGGSSDRTVSILKEYAERHDHIRWISEPDEGQSDAMNKGIALAQHDIIGFLNCDDSYEPNVFSSVANVFKDFSRPSFVAANCNVWEEDGTLIFTSRPKHLRLEDLIIGWRIKPYRRLPINPSSYFYHKALHEAIGPYKNDEHYQMDIDFLLRIVQVAYLHYVDEIWGNLYLRKGTKTYEDRARGVLYEKTGQLMKHYMRDLDRLSRLKVKTAWYLIERYKKIMRYA